MGSGGESIVELGAGEDSITSCLEEAGEPFGDVYGGYGFEVVSNLNLDASIIYYYYPGDGHDPRKSYVEGHLGADYTFKDAPLSPKIALGYNYYPDFFGEDGDGHYVSGRLDLALPWELTLYGMIGYQWVEGDKSSGNGAGENGENGYDYVHYRIGVSRPVLGFVLDLYYSDTDNENYLGEAHRRRARGVLGLGDVLRPESTIWKNRISSVWALRNRRKGLPGSCAKSQRSQNDLAWSLTQSRMTATKASLGSLVAVAQRLRQQRVSQLLTLMRSVDRVGGMTAEAALECGLQEGTPVFGGGGDAQAAAVGSRGVSEGNGHIYLGTSGWVGITTRKAPTGRHGVVNMQSADPGMSLLFAEMETAGACLKWIADEFDRAEQADPAIPNIYALMDQKVQTVPPGSDYLICTPCGG